MSNEKYHVPVLTAEVVRTMSLKSGGIYVDCTVGGGGHSLALLQENPSITLFCFDQDEDAIRQAKKTLTNYKKQVIFIQDNFRHLKTHLALHKLNKIDGVLMDIGVSNHQLTTPKRGFSFTHDGKLDMRMNRSSSICAHSIVNKYSNSELTKIFYEYGEEEHAKKIARYITIRREIAPIDTTSDLAEIIYQCLPPQDKPNSLKIKARIFQAIRIAVNNELDVLCTALHDAITLLNQGSRLLVISWHSLEDRIVKNAFRKAEGHCDCPPNIPICGCKKVKKIRNVTKKPTIPTAHEISLNSNARSAKLRVAEKI
jgi:16S rRNA (cytosine1402-N4)-methyltransferase